jgi:DNA-binding transcriptional ArsR family regulator
MNKVIFIDTIEKLDVISVPIRIRIMNHLRYEAYSPKKLSLIMDQSPQSLNYHFNQLYKAGFIYKKYEEKKRGVFETFFQANGEIIRVDHQLLNDLDNTDYKEHFSSNDDEEKKLIDQLNMELNS